MRLTTPGTVKVEQAAYLLGMDKWTLMRALKNGQFKWLGEAFKSEEGNTCYSFNISKFALFTFLGYDVNLPIEDAIQKVKDGNPPWIDQVLVLAKIKKDTPTVESEVSSLMNSR